MSAPDTIGSPEPTGAPATVVWWREDRERRFYDLLEVSHGPVTSPTDAWPRQFVQSPGTAEGWAVASLPGLGALTEELTARLRPPVALEAGGEGSLSVAVLDRAGEVVEQRTGVGDDPLYDACRGQAINLLSQRLRQRAVRTDPLSSGVVLVRIRFDDDRPILDLAPAVASLGSGDTSIPVTAIAPGVRADRAQRFSDRIIEPRELEASPGAFDVALAGSSGPIGTVTGISYELPSGRPDGAVDAVLARVELEMPPLHYPALEQRWPKQSQWGRRCYLVVDTGAPRGR
jgi:hypothetical protein